MGFPYDQMNFMPPEDEDKEEHQTDQKTDK
jgi:hypothetical protein